jgi:hypothetical protein
VSVQEGRREKKGEGRKGARWNFGGSKGRIHRERVSEGEYIERESARARASERASERVCVCAREGEMKGGRGGGDLWVEGRSMVNADGVWRFAYLFVCVCVCNVCVVCVVCKVRSVKRV